MRIFFIQAAEYADSQRYRILRDRAFDNARNDGVDIRDDIYI